MNHRKFTVDLFLGLFQPTIRAPLHLSPDGRKLIVNAQLCRRADDAGGDLSYTATGIPREMMESRVFVVDTVDGTFEEPFPSGSTSWAAQWSPDGTQLAAYVQLDGRACLGVWERTSGQSRLHTHVPVRPFFGFEVPRWMPDSRSLVVKLVATHTQKNSTAMDATQANSAKLATVFSFTPGAQQDEGVLPGWADGYICDLARIDSVTGEIQRLVEDYRLIGWKIAPDGHAVAALRYVEADPKLQQFYFDLMVLPVDYSSPRLLARRVPQDYGICFNWSPDSQFIAYTTQERGGHDCLYVVAADGSTGPQRLNEPGEKLTLLNGDVEAPRWSENGHTLYCLAPQGCWEFASDGSSRRSIALALDRNVVAWLQPPTSGILWTPLPGTLLYLMRNPRTKDTGLVRVDMNSGEETLIGAFPRRSGEASFEMEVSTDGSLAYLFLESSDRPAEVWQYYDSYQRHKQLFVPNTRLEEVAVGTSRLLEYRTLDGERRQAALLLPAGYTEGGTVPVVVVVYGGSNQSNSLHSFGVTQDLLHGQLLASHGYAVLCPDIPLKDRDPLKQLPGQVIPAITHLIDLGIADPERIGLMGQSYGGYCTLALLVQTTIFSAAVACAGYYDLTSAYLALSEDGSDESLGWCESGQGRIGGSLWEKRDAYIENSPIFYLDQVQTPVLLLCGSKDADSPVQAEAAFVGLRRLGKRVELRRYEGEGHWPGTWSTRSYQDLCTRVLSWFDEYLRV